MSVKALLNYVLEEVAIDGAEGTDVEELFKYVNDFYVKSRQERHYVGELLWADQLEGRKEDGDEDMAGDGDEAAAERDRIAAECWGTPNVKEEFQEYVWGLLRQQKDFNVGPKNESRGMSLGEIVDKWRENKDDANLRVYASEDRRWRTLTGHGPDPKRVPNAVFKCLEVIGKHREQGLIQPDLTKITGQDKKSIAGRTTLLKEMGYIEKVAVLAKSMNTSKLTLTKFAYLRDRKLAQDHKDDSGLKGKPASSKSSERWTGETIHLESLIRAIIAELKNAKNGVIQRGDLKKKLGMDRSRFHWRSLSRILRKVESFGVWKRIRVPLANNRSYDKKGGGTVTVRCHARCIKFVRDITAEDWRRLANSSKMTIGEEDEEEDEASDAEEEKGEREDEAVDVDAINEQLAHVDVDAIEKIPREVPRWTMTVPMPNIIYNLVKGAGKEGISSMDVVHRIIGPFYYRPMDQVLHRMTDFPSKSQPIEYIHLAVIRETSITHRQTHYHYFCYESHQQLVKEGLAVEPWAITSKKKGVKKGSQTEASERPSPEPVEELDEYGFPPVATRRLVKKDGSASLADSSNVGKSKENTAAMTGKPGWKKGVARTGRPRKYPKGEEPYLSAKKRKAILEAAATEAGESPNPRNGEGEDATTETPVPTPKRRGRPPKKQKTDDGTPVEPKRRGRPPKNRAAATKANTTPATPAQGTQESKAPAGVPEASKTPLQDFQVPETPASSAAKGKEKRAIRATKTSKATVPPVTPQASQEANPDVTAPVSVDATPTPAPVKQGRPRKTATPRTVTPKTPRTTRKRKAVSPPPAESAPDKRSRADALPDTNAQVPLVLEEPTDVPMEDAPAPEALETLGEPVVVGPQEIVSGGAGRIPEPSPMAEPVNTPMKIEAAPEKEPEPLAPEPKIVFNIDGIPVENEGLEEGDNDSYGSIGGMLALGRQQVVLDLMAEHDGVFPGGNELRHAFNQKYRQRNPKAGIADRRLVRGVVQSLQYKGKINQFTFSFLNGRGILTTKKLLVDIKIPMESPMIAEAVRQMKAADGGLWYPPGVDLAPEVKEKMLNPTNTWVQAPQSAIEETEFDRIYPTSVENIKKQREERAVERAVKNAQKAEEKRVRQEMRALKKSGIISHYTGKFTEEQKEEARRRKAELSNKIHKLRHKFQGPMDDEAEEDTGPQTIWWEDFVQRPSSISLLKDIKDVRNWEMLNKYDKSLNPAKEDGLVMINHFGPEVEVGEDFSQVPPSMEHIVRNTVSKTGGVKRTVGRPSLYMAVPRPRARIASLTGVEEDDGGPPPVGKKRRRRRVLQKEPTVSRRQQAMAAIHQTTTLETVDEEQEVHARKDWRYRNKYTIPKEDEDTLLIAVIIVRTIFGNVDRKINWDLVRKATPQHLPVVLQRRWPRVRDVHKTHLKKLQSEFEEMYLEAYANDELPVINLKDPMSFDLPLHVKWFRDNLELPEAHAVPELSAKREVFDNLYNLRLEKPSTWRADYHNPTFTMGNRANHFVCYAYEVPISPEVEINKSSEVVDYVKSIIKANVITDAASYNPAEAFALIHEQPEDAVDEAFFELNSNKVVAHRKEHNRVAPGRNYELTDKFHSSLRTPMDEKLFAQALKFDRNLKNMFVQQQAVELSPFLNDGSVACIFDLVANGRVRLEKREYKANAMGLVDGYETRSMPKHMVDFKVFIMLKPSYFERPVVAPLPPTPEGKNPANPIEPMRIWIDMNRNVIKGMWLRVVTSVLSMITGRPGIHPREISKMLCPGLTLKESLDVIQWLCQREAIEIRGNVLTEDSGCWAREGFYRALGGL